MIIRNAFEKFLKLKFFSTGQKPKKFWLLPFAFWPGDKLNAFVRFWHKKKGKDLKNGFVWDDELEIML